MNIGLYRGAAAMHANERRLETIASNLANLRVNGFKRSAVAQHAPAGLEGNPQHRMVWTARHVDWSQGPLERTGVATDVALMGDGFLAVEGPEGELYTRDGQLQLNEAGVLVTQEGYAVAWDGARGQIDPTSQPMVIDLTGQVSQDGRRLGRLKLVDFGARDRLQAERRGYYSADPALNRIPATAEVHQYAVEGANVSPVDELVALIETQRAFQAGSQVVQLISQSYQRLANAAQ